MTFPGYIDDEQLALMHDVLDAYCKQFAVDAVGRELTAVRIVALFTSGTTDAEEIAQLLRQPQQL